MKQIKLIFCIFLAFSAFVSCEEENLDPVGEWELSSPALISSENSIILDEEIPSESFNFQWDAAVSSERYQIRYTVVLDTMGSEDYSTPLLSKVSENGGKDTNVGFSAAEIDLALSYAGYPSGEEIELDIAVIAQSIEKVTTDAQVVSIKRFETEYLPKQLYISGAATENQNDLSQAIPLRALKDVEGNLTYQFETYTHLEANEGFKIYSKQALPAHVYGGADGILQKNGNNITVAESGEYRISVNINDNTYELFKIDHFSFVGEGIPNGWGGDEPLEYQGNGIWQKELYLQVPESGQGGFLFRANEDWGYLFKRIAGTENEIYMESQAGVAGVAIEDITFTASGNYLVSMDLSSTPYTYSLEQQEEEVTEPPSEIPETLFLLADGENIATFEKEEKVFKSIVYIPLQAEVVYQLNSEVDGSGTAYNLSGILGDSSNPDGNSVFGNLTFSENEGEINVARDQAYTLEFDFSTGNVTWKYYNIKLFHWDEAGGGWDNRDEFLMTYIHPHKFTTTHELQAGYDLKFNSPWDIQFGADDPTAMTGSMTNNGGSNFKNITTTGNYTINIQVSNTYETGTYEFLNE